MTAFARFAHREFFAAVLVLAGSSGWLMAQSITTVLPISGGLVVKPAAVNSNGNAVVGFTDDFNSNDRALRWTNPGGSVSLGLLPGGVFNSYAQAIDASGTILAGYGDSGSTRAFRWTNTGGYQILPVAPGVSPSNFNIAKGISQSGAIVVGTAGLSSGGRAFVWSASSPGASTNLGVIAGQSSSDGLAVSGDGSWVVGASGTLAFRSTIFGGGMISLGSLPGQLWAMGEAVNTNGTVITGRYSNGSEFGYRWTSTGGMMALPPTPNGCTALRPRAINGDGTLIIGQVVDNVAGFTAFVWTPTMGTQLLANHLAARGVNLTGWQLKDATGISADGRAMCGTGVFGGNVVGWVVKDLPCVALQFTAGSTSGCVGGTALLDSLPNVVTGAVYRWEKNGVPLVNGLQPSGSFLSGATTNSLTWTNVQPGDGGAYTFLMSSQGACEGSLVFGVPEPIGGTTISTQPSANTACVGQNPGLFSTAFPTVSGTIQQRWQRFVSGNWVDIFDGPSGNGGSLIGTNTTTFSILNAQIADSGLYRSRFTNSLCPSSAPSFSNAVQFTILGSPTVTGPGDSYQCFGDNDAFIGVTVSPAVPPLGSYTYRWQKYVGPTVNSYVDIFDGPTGNGGSFGQTGTAVLGVYSFNPGEVNLYRCRVTGPCGSPVTGPAGLLSGVPTAAIITNPVNTQQCPGDNDAFFSVTATPGVTYQWQKLITSPNVYANIANGPTGNGGNYGGATSPNLSVNGCYAADFTRYRCVVTDVCAGTTATSANALLSATPEAVITSGPSPTFGCLLGNASLSVTATPAGNTYQWQKKNPIFLNVYNNVINGPTGNGGTFSGAQSPTLTITGVFPADIADYFRCIVNGPCALVPAVSNDALFQLFSQPSILTQPIGGPVCNGGTKQLSVTPAPGNFGTLTYQWWRFVPAFPIFAMVSNGALPSGAIVSGATTSTLTLSNFKPQDAGQYYCNVIGDCSNVNTIVVNLTSCPADFNCSGAVTVQDIFDFLAAWFSGLPSADFNNTNTVTVQDIFDFLGAWFVGC